ncbi:MAG: hypothetical protein R3F62_09640 [Planctomycetota bacterium]
MSDRRTLELERRYRETGAAEDGAAWLRERERTGDVSRESLELAAYCGDVAARRLLGEDAPEPAEWTRGLQRFHAEAVGRFATILAGLARDALGLDGSEGEWTQPLQAKAYLAAQDASRLRNNAERCARHLFALRAAGARGGELEAAELQARATEEAAEAAEQAAADARAAGEQAGALAFGAGREGGWLKAPEETATRQIERRESGVLRAEGSFIAAIRAEGLEEVVNSLVRSRCGDEVMDDLRARSRAALAAWALRATRGEVAHPPRRYYPAPERDSQAPFVVSQAEEDTAAGRLAEALARYQASGSAADEAAWLRARVAWARLEGPRSPRWERVVVAASFGYPPLSKALGDAAPPQFGARHLATSEAAELGWGVFQQDRAAGARLGLLVGALALNALPPRWSALFDLGARVLDALVEVCEHRLWLADPGQLESALGCHSDLRARIDLCRDPEDPLFAPEHRAALGALRCAGWGAEVFFDRGWSHGGARLHALLGEALEAGLQADPLVAAGRRYLLPWLLDLRDPPVEDAWRTLDDAVPRGESGGA